MSTLCINWIYTVCQNLLENMFLKGLFLPIEPQYLQFSSLISTFIYVFHVIIRHFIIKALKN